ncbi:MAG: fused MFS/spermidine synthase [Actinomycetota bacterium]
MAEAIRVEERPVGATDGRAPTLSLNALVFCAGAGSLATEIGAARLLAPYYGSSTIVWANVIGLVLASLSVGYWLGGRLADRRPEPRVLGAVVLVAAVLIAIVPFAAGPFLDVSVNGLDQVSAGAALGSFFAVLALFAPPVTLLGMVAPFAIRLAIDDVRDAGSVAGRLYALSTIGSLLGTFASALVAIPTIGTQRTLLCAAVLVALPGAALLGRRWLVVAAAIGALLAVPAGSVRAEPGLIFQQESRYQFIHVTEQHGVRRLYLNEGLAVHSIWHRDTVLTGGEWDTYLAVPPLLGRPLRRVAILGNAGGTTARALGVFYPDARVDGVELDPAVTTVGRRFFGLNDNPRLRVITADARPFLRQTNERYDLIVVDAYRPPYVPFYLATHEFFRLARSRLSPGGALVLNVGTVPGDHRLADGVSGTLATEFPLVLTWQPLLFNQFLIGLDRAEPKEVLIRRLGHGPLQLRPLQRLLAHDMKTAAPSADPWTDDRAPVEWLTDRMILEFAARGGLFEEYPLPTAP